MLQPNESELSVLSVFYSQFQPRMGYYNRQARTINADAKTQGHFQKNLEIVRTLAKKNIPASRLKVLMRTAKKNNLQAQWVTDIVPQEELEYLDEQAQEANLIKPGLVYSHHLLMKVEMPVARIEFCRTKSQSDGPPTVSVVPSFTMRELVSYFCTQMEIGQLPDGPKYRAFVGGMEFLLGQYGLENILYAIDIAVQNEDFLANPLRLTDKFIDEAIAITTDLAARRDN